MLGPISFINASCNANVEYKQIGKIVCCVAKKDIKIGEELTVFYSRHFFGNFNENCLCPFKNEHGNPWPDDPEPPRKKRKHRTDFASTPVNEAPNLKLTNIPTKRISIDKLPPRRLLYETAQSCGNEEVFLSFDSIFGSFDVPSPIQIRTSQSTNVEFPPPDSHSELSFVESEICFQRPAAASTPRRLDLIEDEVDHGNRFCLEEGNLDLFQGVDDTPFYEGAQASTESFMLEFNNMADRNEFSKFARQDLLKLFARTLPAPNNLFAKLSVPFLPNICTIELANSKLCFVDIRSQIEKILLKNAKYVLSSWTVDYSWKTAWDCFQKPEIQLVLNFDGAPVFKASKIAVWPVWVQIFNLPSKLRGAFSNLCLLALWHGKAKPDFSKLLPRCVFELESLFCANLKNDDLGVVKFSVRSVVADMPATACILCMNQFNGYSSCPHCYIRVFSQNHRMLFSVKKTFVLRESQDFKACGFLADQSGEIKSGIRSQFPLNNVISLPWNCPLDPMHQVFLGTGKTLSKLIVSLATNQILKKAETYMTFVKVPFDIQYRTKSLSDIKFWKVFDFKLFFFHVAPLVFHFLPIEKVYFKSFMTLCLAIRLISNAKIKQYDIDEADVLIQQFFENFVDHYGEESQSFNFHTMRHLSEQVKRNGPLWCFSAFCFESANHCLLSAVQGTIKEREAIVEQFIKHQASYDRQHATSEKCLRGITVVIDSAKTFCDDMAVEFFLLGL